MFLRLVIAALSVSLVTGRPSSAQSVATDRHNFETRVELEGQAKAAEAKADKGEAWLIRYRLNNGDFRAGDRIVVTVPGTGGFSDTLVVHSGKRLQLPQMGDLSLEGVLRSELTPQLTTYIAKYLRDPVVRANPLVRVGVLGSVTRPGYYYAAADLPLSDLLMSAGGPTSEADVAKVSIRREGQIIMDQENTRRALVAGMSLDMLHLQAGDEISVGRQRRFNWGVIAPIVTGLLGLLIAFTQLRD